MKLFLDDIRNPKDCLGYMYKRIGKDNFLYLEEWNIVRNYIEFVVEVTKAYKNNLAITHISFDHDLADEHYNPDMFDNPERYKDLKFQEKTGYDCAKWYKEFLTSHKLKQPIMYVHSMNPVGTENIINLFK